LRIAPGGDIGRAAPYAHAGIITPAGLNPGDQFRVVFVTTTLTDAMSNDLTGHYDPIVRKEAADAGINTYSGFTVIWKAIGSTATVNAVDRLPMDSVPIFLPDGTKVADSGTALWSTTNSSTLLHAINEKADGTRNESIVWTGTFADGTTDPRFALGSGGPFVEIGDSRHIERFWIDEGTQHPNVPLELYGFSDVLTVPGTTAVPEPGALTLVVAGVGGLVGARLTRRRRCM
jgi:hypothetical protein